MATAWTPLATITLSAAQMGVTFSSISQAYRDLVVVISGNLNGSDNQLYCQFNGVTSASYAYVTAENSGASGISGSSGSATQIQSAHYGATISGTSTSFQRIDVLDYSATDKHKPVLIRAGSTATNVVSMVAGRFANTAAITSIYVYQWTGTYQLAAGTTVSLYGVSA